MFVPFLVRDGDHTPSSGTGTINDTAAPMLRRILLIALLAAAEAFVATPMRPVTRAPAAPAMTAPTMALEPSSIDAATSLIALGLPIPAFTPAKAFIMMFSNILIICTMSIDGKGLARGTSHDEMVESFGLTWLLSGASLGHIVGAGAILGCQAGGFPGL